MSRTSWKARLDGPPLVRNYNQIIEISVKVRKKVKQKANNRIDKKCYYYEKTNRITKDYFQKKKYESNSKTKPVASSSIVMLMTSFVKD